MAPWGAREGQGEAYSAARCAREREKGEKKTYRVSEKKITKVQKGLAGQVAKEVGEGRKDGQEIAGANPNWLFGGGVGGIQRPHSPSRMAGQRPTNASGHGAVAPNCSGQVKGSKSRLEMLNETLGMKGKGKQISIVGDGKGSDTHSEAKPHDAQPRSSRGTWGRRAYMQR